jgi:hypothetical protein
MAVTAAQKYLLNKMNSIAHKVQLGTLLDSATPTYKVVYAGTHTSVGGDATEAITVTGALSTDLVFVQLKTAGATPRTVVTAVPTTNTVTVTLSGDPSTDHVLYYQVLRAVS